MVVIVHTYLQRVGIYASGTRISAIVGSPWKCSDVANVDLSWRGIVSGTFADSPVQRYSYSGWAKEVRNPYGLTCASTAYS